MKKIVVLGAGLIGKAIAIDLCKDYAVTSADIQKDALQNLSAQHPITTSLCDFKNKEALVKLITPFDLVILAVPGHFGFEILKTILEQGKNVVDISFFPEDPFLLDKLAKENNCTVVVDCGVAPGMCNIIAGYHNKKEKLISYECLVGGLPRVPEWPFNYKAVFSPIDVIEEYTRPSRYKENNSIIVKTALTDIETVLFDQAGELESFNTDGLRTLLTTLAHVPNLKEKTLRYAGHAELMKVFRETGLFDKDPIDIKGSSVSPLELTSKLLFSKWKLKPGEEDFTVMRVTVEDNKNKYVYNLFDLFDKQSQTTSMARTTGYTCTAVARLVVENTFNRKGICPPEFIGEDDACFNSVINYLKDRNIIYKKEVFKKESTH